MFWIIKTTVLFRETLSVLKSLSPNLKLFSLDIDDDWVDSSFKARSSIISAYKVNQIGRGWDTNQNQQFICMTKGVLRSNWSDPPFTLSSSQNFELFMICVCVLEFQEEFYIRLFSLLWLQKYTPKCEKNIWQIISERTARITNDILDSVTMNEVDSSSFSP